MPSFFAHVNWMQKGVFKAASWPLLGVLIGTFFDMKETERMTMFRDKSALYRREMEEGEKPSWP